MIIPSIDIMGGQAVQLVGGERLALEAGDPLAIAEAFSVVGEIAVIDLDAALGQGSNREIIEQIVARYPCRETAFDVRQIRDDELLGRGRDDTPPHSVGGYLHDVRHDKVEMLRVFLDEFDILVDLVLLERRPEQVLWLERPARPTACT